VTVVESSLLGTVYVETSPNTGTATWTDQTDTLVSLSLSRGGREDYVGAASTNIGSGSITFRDNANTIEPGNWVRVRTTDNLWAGYVTDVNTQVVFENNQSYEIKTLLVADWVSYASSIITGPVSSGDWYRHAARINTALGYNLMLYWIGLPPTGPSFGMSEYPSMTLSEICRISANSVPNGFWFSRKTSPTNGTTGRSALLALNWQPSTSTGLNLTDGSFSDSSSLFYNSIQIENNTSDVSNAVTVTNTDNRALYYTGDWYQEDSTSISTYGQRTTSIDVGVQTTTGSAAEQNLIPDPALQYSMDYTISGAGNMSFQRAALSTVNTGATYYLTSGATQPTGVVGDYVAMGKITANLANAPIWYGGTEGETTSPRIPITASTQYTASVYMRQGLTQTNTTGYCAIRWYDDAGAVISTSNGTSTTMSTSAWTRRTVTATAPATARTATVFAWFVYSGANNTNYRYFSTGAQLETASSASTWFSGDSTDTSTFVHWWSDGEGTSASLRQGNVLDLFADDFLTANANPIYAPRRVTLNAQDNIALIDDLELYQTVDVYYNGTQWTQYITGIKYNLYTVDNYISRFMVDIELRPSTAI
jgi:hypothetical protein